MYRVRGWCYLGIQSARRNIIVRYEHIVGQIRSKTPTKKQTTRYDNISRIGATQIYYTASRNENIFLVTSA